jgi:hypothetical protein
MTPLGLRQVRVTRTGVGCKGLRKAQAPSTSGFRFLAVHVPEQGASVPSRSHQASPARLPRMTPETWQESWELKGSLPCSTTPQLGGTVPGLTRLPGSSKWANRIQ